MCRAVKGSWLPRKLRLTDFIFSTQTMHSDGKTRGKMRDVHLQRTWTLASRSLTTVLSVMAAVFAATPALACDCLPPTLEKQLASSVAVFFGRVASITNDGVAFEVAVAWKGGGERTVLLNQPESTCSYPFSAGREYLVFVHRDGAGRLGASVDHCGLTRPADEAHELLAQLGPSSVKYEYPLNVRFVATALTVLAAAFGGLVLLLFRRGRRSR
jgi:hypothetical protein